MRRRQVIEEYVNGLTVDEIDDLLEALDEWNAARQTGTTERSQVMSWQNGYGNQNTDAVYGGLDNAKELGGARFPFFDAGRHKVAVVLLEEYQSKDGPAVRLIGEILESTTHKVGDLHTKIWKITQPPKFPNGTTPADEFADFCRKLKGAPKGVAIGESIRVLMKDRANEQLARGMVIGLTGVTNKKGNWTNLYWENIPQTPQEIAQHRQRIEASGLAQTAAAGTQQAPAQPQYNQAPPQQQFVQQPMQQQFVPPQAQSQYVQQPIQPQYVQQPQGQVVHQANTGIATPVQGGFLSQLPPTNGQGGQNGGGSSW